MQTRTPEHNERKCHMICKNPFVIKLGKNRGISLCDLHELRPIEYVVASIKLEDF